MPPPAELKRDARVRRKCVTFVGPFPPPAHGQSIATEALASRLEAAGIQLDRRDVTAKSGWGKIFKHLRAAVALTADSGPCYISLNSNSGMWLSALLAAAARLRGRATFIHHHAYDHVRRRRSSMIATALLAGPKAVHIVLGPRMAADIVRSTPEVKCTMVLNNAGLVQSGADRPPRTPNAPISLGHLGNLTREKGILQVVEAAIAAHGQGHDITLHVAGPCHDEWASRALSLAEQRLGSRLFYHGPVGEAAKAEFYSKIDVFLFPSAYKNEAEPLVLLEALASGVMCVATRMGCIEDDLRGGGGECCSHEEFTNTLLTVLRAFAQDREAPSSMAVRRFQSLRDDHECQVRELTASLGR
jgi:Glycosyl transferases group 1